MQYAACQVSIAPLRSHPAEKSEMVSQLLFGETVEIDDERDNWRHVICSWDGVTGWMDGKQLQRLTASEYDTYREDASISLSLVEGLMADNHFLPLTLGAALPCFDGLRCRLGERAYQFAGLTANPEQTPRTGDWIARVARRYLHAPYLWGGRSPFGIDGPGLTQMVFKTTGVRLLRDAGQQVTQGRPVDFMEQCQTGDLAFFDHGRGEVNHVGIIMPDCHVIHACGQVRIDKLDHFGIFNRSQGRYTHQLRIVKRLLPDAAPPDAVDTAAAVVYPDHLPGQTALFE